MQTETISLEETDCFSQTFIDYISQKEELKPFYHAFPSVENFKEIIKQRNFSLDQRNVLSDVLSNQYAEIEKSTLVSANIEKLKDRKTFTVTTGHQLNIFTGPLYFIYKIVTVINACKRLKEAYPEYEFIPVYWMASEDHDFEEISYFHFGGEKREWKTDQKGAVGRMDPNELLSLARSLPSDAHFFEDAYSQPTLASAARYYVNHLFGEEGLIVVDADDPKLKKALVPVIEDDLFQHGTERLVAESSKSLEALGFKTQVNARPINFFYLENDIRERIERDGDLFKVVDTELQFSSEEIKELIQTNPERFSPNVILRPLYQEMILPNLAYVGGPSELIYWLQFNAVFEHFNVSFPALMPRNFATIISKQAAEKWNKTGLDHADLFLDAHQATTKWVEKNSDHELSYQKELNKLEELISECKKKAEIIDPTLVQHLEALNARFTSRIEKAEKKLLRAEKRKHEAKKNQIESVKESIFPGGTLQERKVNFLEFYSRDNQFIHHLLKEFDPFNFEMYLLFE